MAFKDILIMAPAAGSFDPLLSCADKIGSIEGVFVTGLVVKWIPALPTMVEGWVVDANWNKMLDDARDDAKQSKRILEEKLENQFDHCAVHSSLLEVGAARNALGLRARHADITIVRQPDFSARGYGDATLLEAAMFAGGHPVLVVPPEWEGKALGRSVLVCWNAGREAARALADAAPLIATADKVTVVTVDAEPSMSGYGDLPGMDISAHLARRGLEVELRNVDSAGREDYQAILDEAANAKADLIVMGGYGRSRLSEMVFGGVTRDMLTHASLPILMSH